MPRLSLIIPTRNAADLNCLDSISQHTKNYEVHVVEGNDGFAAKLNLGVEYSKGEYLIFLHDDCEVTPGWTDELAEVGAFKLGESNDLFDTWGGFINPPSYCQDPTQNPDYAYWLCIHRDAMKKIGKFDERFENPMFQDVDFGLQVKKAGYKIKCLPGKIIHRNSEQSGTPDERQRGYLNRKWNIEL